ncbi:unnamed protein product [Spirodela intermedia]|uniref:Uncharacterized protein n=1 Tax=Spirodela intermedia TaxID=51605 RepID=A0A7I8K6J1_SPIIN|nr:unnamed protein product [Spirodela intermedia]
MGSGVLPSHAILSLPATTAPRSRLRLPFSVSSSSFAPHCLSVARIATSFTPAGAARRGILSAVRAAEDEDAAAVAVEVGGDSAEESSEEGAAEVPRKPIVKLGDIMGILHKRAIEASETTRPVPELRTGDIVEIKLEVPENRRRVSIYKGIVMSRQNAGIHTTIRIRRIIAGIGVEIVFPIYSPNIKEIKVVKHRKVRRARLYYLRDKLPRLSTFN